MRLLIQCVTTFRLGMLCLALTSTCNQAAHAAKNILFIAVDDLRPELGCYGAQHAQTPNLDKLAARSTLFTNHFVQVPTCGASRYALLTGQSPASSGVTSSNNALYAGKTALNSVQQAGAQSLPELFNRSGYETVLIGKISHTADGRVYEYNGAGNGRHELPHAWDNFATPLGSWGRGWGIFFAYANGSHREDGGGHKDLMEFIVEKDTDLPDGQMADEAVKKLAELKMHDEPFFMGLGFFKPHLPFVAPQQDWDAFADVDIPAPPHPQKPDSPYWHSSGEFFKYNFPFDKKPLSEDGIRNCRRAYMACVRYTDRQIGKVLNALEEQGLAESTVVIVWGDHGWNLGDSGMWAKHTPFERAVRSPLIIHSPEHKPAQCDALVETIDLYPTLMDLCKPDFTKTQYQLDGESLRPVLNDPNSNVREVAFSYWRDAITARTKQFRLIAKHRNGQFQNVELYDSQNGFDPVKNLASEYPEVLNVLLKQCREELAGDKVE